MLRPLSAGELLDRAFNLYRNNFVLFAGIMLPPQILLFAGIVWTYYPLEHATSAYDLLAAFDGIIGRGILSTLSYSVSTALGQAAIMYAVSQLYVDRHPSIWESYKSATQRFWPVIGVGILVSIGICIGIVAIIIGAIIVYIFSVLAIPVVVLEKLEAIAALRRSITLVRGSVWRIALICVVFIAVSYAVKLLVGVPILGVLLAFPSARTATVSLLVQQVSIFITQVLTSPLLFIAISILYYDQRVRKEALDLMNLNATDLSVAKNNPAQFPE